MQEGGRRVRKRDIGEMEGRETDGRKIEGGKIDRKERRKNGAMKEK